MANEIVRKIAHSIGLLTTTEPTFFIVGAQKSGTSYLFNFLHRQTAFSSSYKKELDFFSSDMNYKKGKKWYLKHFIFRRKQTTFEACPNYLYYIDSHKRMFDFNPNAKIIVLLRNPVDRAFSAWNMHKKMWTNRKEDLINNYYHILNQPQKSQGIHFIRQKKFPSFHEAIQQEINLLNGKNFKTTEPGFISRGIYYNQIESLFSFFEQQQILIIENEELKNQSLLIEKLEQFLNKRIEPLVIDKELRFSGTYSSPMDKKSKTILQEYYKPKNELLFQLLGKNYSW